jgi:hypothetical protein
LPEIVAPVDLEEEGDGSEPEENPTPEEIVPLNGAAHHPGDVPKSNGRPVVIS